MYWMDYTHHIGNIMVYSWLVCCLFLFIFHVSLHLGHEMGTWAILEALPHFGNTRAHNHICIYIYYSIYIYTCRLSFSLLSLQVLPGNNRLGKVGQKKQLNGGIHDAHIL
jgi:hypothetical protein